MTRANTSRRHRSRLEPLERRTLLAAATVNFSDVRQTIDGFGSESAYTPAPTAAALQQAYSQADGIGLTFLRGSINQDGSTHQVDMMKKAAPYGVKFIMSARAAPSEWIANYNTTDGGYLVPSHYQDYANLLADSAQDWAAQGVPIYAIDFTVEPDLATTSPYTYMVWDQQQFADVLPVVATTFRARGIATKIILPESYRWDFSLADQVMADPGLSQYVDVLAAHGYDQSDVPYAPVNNAQGRPIWMTEYILNNSSQTATQNAVALASDIHEALTVANASAYLYFWMSDGSSSYLMTNWAPNKRFWALGNYSKFVRPGWVRVGETDDGGLDLTTFKDPATGKFAIVAANSGSAGVTETYTLSGISASSVTPYVTSATDDLAQSSGIAVSGGTFTATIAANTVVTYYGVSTAAPTLHAPTNLTVAPVYAAPTTQLSLTWSDNSAGETGYTVERSTDGNTWSVLTSSLGANTTSYVDAAAAEGTTTYYYRVKPSNSASSYSSVTSGSTILAAPSNLAATAISGGLRLGWTINSAASSGVSIQRSLDGITWSTIASLPTRATTYDDVVSGYNSSRIYFYRVRNTLGSKSSAFADYNTTPKSVSSFRAAVVSPTSVTFTWTNNAVGAFAAVIQNGNAGWQNAAPPNLGAGAGTFTINGLTENTANSFRIAVVAGGAGTRFGGNYGAWSAYTYVSPTTPIAPPSGLTAVSTGATTARLTWTDNSAVETAYTVERSTDGMNWTVLTSTLAADSTSYTDSSSPSGTCYYRVKATVSTVSSAYVRTQRVTSAPGITTSATVTGATTNLSSAAPAGFGSGTLTYAWSLDAAPPAGVTFSANGTSAASSTTATFAAAGSYVFRVTISDSAGNTTSASTTVTVNQTLTDIAVTDYAARASYGGGAASTPAIVKSTFEQLAATAYDQFGDALGAQPTFTWSVVSGGGSVSSAGLYSAPASAGSPVVRASSDSVWAQLTLSVLDAAQLAAGYGFNEMTGWNLQDALGAGVTAKMSGGATLVPGRLANAVDFGGVDGSVWMGNPDALDIRGQITIAAWVQPDFTSGTRVIVCRGIGHYPNQSATYLRISNGQYQVGFYDSSYHNAAFAIPAGDAGNWVHLVGTYDGKTWRLYRNGALVASYVNARGSTYVPKPWHVGSSDDFNDYFSGKIDSVRLYEQALSASEVAALFSRGIVITSPAAASPPSVQGTSTNLSVAAIDPDTNADSLFTYAWSVTTGPAPVTFSANGTNAAKLTTANFTGSGDYTLQVTIRDVSGMTTTSTVNVTVDAAAYVSNNHLYVNFGGSATSLSAMNSNIVVASGGHNYTFDRASFADVLVTGSSGNDALTIDGTGGNPLPAGGLSFDGGAGDDLLVLKNMTAAAPVAFAAGAGNDSVVVDGGSFTFAADLALELLRATDAGTVTLDATQHLGGLVIDPASTVTLAQDGSRALVLGSLSVTGGKLDLEDNHLIVNSGIIGSWNGSAYTGITAVLAGGCNGGDWSGTGGIVTTMPGAASGYTSLAVATATDALGIRAADTALWRGETVAGGSVLVAYTYGGDANLDGVVNIDDYTQIDSSVSVGGSLKGWYNGDFNYDGEVNIDDYTIIDSNIAIQGPPFPAAVTSAGFAAFDRRPTQSP